MFRFPRCTWRQDSVVFGEVRGPDGSRGKWQSYETRDVVLAHVHLVLLWRFNCHAGAQVGGDLETAASKNKDMKESGIRARCS